jgi:hypothetical protein
MPIADPVTCPSIAALYYPVSMRMRVARGAAALGDSLSAAPYSGELAFAAYALSGYTTSQLSFDALTTAAACDAHAAISTLVIADFFCCIKLSACSGQGCWVCARFYARRSLCRETQLVLAIYSDVVVTVHGMLSITFLLRMVSQVLDNRIFYKIDPSLL